MPRERVSLLAARSESAGLGPAVSHWPLSAPGRMNKDQLAMAAAAGIRELLSSSPTIQDRHTDRHRPATGGDLAVLCRTNDPCLHVAEALG